MAFGATVRRRLLGGPPELAIISKSTNLKPVPMSFDGRIGPDW
jgi:hypothetical protein